MVDRTYLNREVTPFVAEVKDCNVIFNVKENEAIERNKRMMSSLKNQVK